MASGHGLRSRLAASLLGLTLAGVPVLGAAQVQTSPDERFFRIDWQMERPGGRPPAIVGSVRNQYAVPVQRLQVQVQIVDATGQTTHEPLVMVSDVPPGGQGNFRLPLPATGARYVITVHSFEFGAVQSP